MECDCARFGGGGRIRITAGASENENRARDLPGGTGNASEGPSEVLVSSGGTVGIGIAGGCAVAVGGGFRAGTRGRFDRDRCWKRLDGESLESRLLFRGQSHLPGNFSVHVHGEPDAAVANALLHELGMGAGFDMKRDECASEIVLADAHDPQRL